MCSYELSFVKLIYDLHSWRSVNCRHLNNLMWVYLCLGPGQLSITDARAGHVAHGVCNVQYGPHYAPAVTRQYPLLMCPRPLMSGPIVMPWIHFGWSDPGPGATREVSNFIISPEIFVADWKIAMNNFTNNTREGQPGESEQDKSNFRFIRQ